MMISWLAEKERTSNRREDFTRWIAYDPILKGFVHHESNDTHNGSVMILTPDRNEAKQFASQDQIIDLLSRIGGKLEIYEVYVRNVFATTRTKTITWEKDEPPEEKEQQEETFFKGIKRKFKTDSFFRYEMISYFLTIIVFNVSFYLFRTKVQSMPLSEALAFTVVTSAMFYVICLLGLVIGGIMFDNFRELFRNKR